MKRFNAGAYTTGLLLAAVGYAVADLPVEETWQHIDLGDKARAIGAVEDRFVVLLEDGRLLTTMDARQWEMVTDLADSWQCVFNEEGMTAFTVHEHNDGSITASILHSADLVLFETLFTCTIPFSEGARTTKWFWPLLDTPGGMIAVLNGPDFIEIILSPDGVSWEPLRRQPGWRMGRAYYRDGAGEVVLGNGLYTMQYLLSEDGINWTALNTFVGSYTYYQGRYIGLRGPPDAAIAVSDDLVYWQDLPVSLEDYPSELVVGAERLLVVDSPRQVWVSEDGLSWQRYDLPELPVFSTGAWSYQASYMGGRFWLRRAYNPKPGSSEEGYAEFIASVDGIDWQMESGYPDGLHNESTLVSVKRQTLPGGVPGSPVSSYIEVYGERAVATELTSAGVTVAIRERDASGLFALFQTDSSGAETVVNTTWASRWTSYPFHRPLQLVSANGAFLCRNVFDRLGYYSAHEAFLQQPRAEAVFPPHRSKLALYWFPVHGAAYYRVHRCTRRTADIQSFILVGETSATYWTDPDPLLQEGVPYYYVVTAHAVNGQESLPGKRITGTMSHEKFVPHPLVDYIYFGPADAGDIMTAWRNAPWIWSREYGWWYVADAAYGLWISDLHAGWLWSASDVYPYFHEVTTGRWLYHMPGTLQPRWLYDCATGTWMADY